MFGRRDNAGRRRFSLKRRLRWSYMLVSAVPLLLMGMLLLNNSFIARRQSVYDDQQTAASWLAREVGREVLTVNEQLQHFAQVLNYTAGDSEVLAVVQNFLRDTPRIRDLSVLDRNGRERVRVSRLRVYFPSELIDRSDEPLVRQALGGELGRSPIIPGDDTTPVYTLHIPIDNGAGTAVGALRAEVDATPLADALAQTPLKAGSYAYLVDRDGVIMISGKPDYQPMFGGYLRALIKGPPEVQEYRDGRDVAVIGARTRVAQAISWWVIVEVPVQFAYGSLWRGLVILALISVLVIITAVGWGLYQAREIIRPILTLRAGARIIGEGDLSHRITAEANDEIGELADEFNRMAEHLQESRSRIELQNERLRGGLALARDIQTGLLPDRAPWNIEQIAVQAASHPAYEVGGDFYSYVTLGEGRVGVAIGDISGKGVGAALLMALTSSAMEAQAREIEHPGKVLTALNAQLAPRLKANHMNAALLHAVIDLQQHSMRVANAGMIAPLLLRDGQVIYVEAYGLPLGSLAEARYDEVQAELRPGDTIILLSDGVVEARNPQGELFGFERLEQLLCQMLLERPEEVVQHLLDEVYEFMGGAEQNDDITLIAIQPQLAAAERSASAGFVSPDLERLSI